MCDYSNILSTSTRFEQLTSCAMQDHRYVLWNHLLPSLFACDVSFQPIRRWVYSTMPVPDALSLSPAMQRHVACYPLAWCARGKCRGCRGFSVNTHTMPGRCKPIANYIAKFVHSCDQHEVRIPAVTPLAVTSFGFVIVGTWLPSASLGEYLHHTHTVHYFYGGQWAWETNLTIVLSRIPLLSPLCSPSRFTNEFAILSKATIDMKNVQT